MYKIKPEISVFGPLAPRHHISSHSFKKLILNRIQTLGGKYCEACNEKAGLIDMHEGFTINSLCYTFEGFYLLCRKCHMNLVHSIPCDEIYITESQLIDLWKGKEGFQKFGKFKNEKEFSNYTLNTLRQTIEFILSDQIEVNYEQVEKYGLNEKKKNRNSYLKTYNHLDSRIRYLLSIARFTNLLDPNKNTLNKNLLLHYKKHEFFLKASVQLSSRDLRESNIKLYVANMILN